MTVKSTLRIVDKLVKLFLMNLLLSSCATKTLWQDETYWEHISGFLVSEDVDQVVVLGDSYHYIFKNDALKKALLSEYRKYYTPRFIGFRVNGDVVVGELRLIMDGDSVADDKLRVWASEAGFVFNGKELTLVLPLEGKRYMPGEDFKEFSKLEKKYSVMVIKDAGIRNVGRILLTPVTVYADAVAAVYVIAGGIVGYVGVCAVLLFSGDACSH